MMNFICYDRYLLHASVIITTFHILLSSTSLLFHDAKINEVDFASRLVGS